MLDPPARVTLCNRCCHKHRIAGTRQAEPSHLSMIGLVAPALSNLRPTPATEIPLDPTALPGDARDIALAMPLKRGCPRDEGKADSADFMDRPRCGPAAP
jgi:hypothetical protein